MSNEMITEYSEAMKSLEKANKENIKGGGSIIHVIGDYGIGKTRLIKSTSFFKESNYFDQFMQPNTEKGAIEINENDKDFGSRLAKLQKINKSISIIKTLLLTSLTSIPMPFLLASDKKWFIQISPLYLFAALLMILSYQLLRKGCLNSNKRVVIIENLDRHDWETILKTLHWTNDMKKSGRLIVLSYSMTNIKDRFKEKYGFHPDNVEFIFEKFVDEYIDLNSEKHGVCKDIVNKILVEEGIFECFGKESLLGVSIHEFEYLNFRVVKACANKMKINEKIIKLLHLDPKAVFMIEYLSYINKEAYYWLKKNMYEFENGLITSKKWNNISNFKESVRSQIRNEQTIAIDDWEHIKTKNFIILIVQMLKKWSGTYIKDCWNLYYFTNTASTAAKIIESGDLNALIKLNSIPSLLKSYVFKKDFDEYKGDKTEKLIFILDSKELSKGTWKLGMIDAININNLNAFELARLIWSYSNYALYISGIQSLDVLTSLSQIKYTWSASLKIKVEEMILDLERKEVNEESDAKILKAFKWIIEMLDLYFIKLIKTRDVSTFAKHAPHNNFLCEALIYRNLMKRSDWITFDNNISKIGLEPAIMIAGLKRMNKVHHDVLFEFGGVKMSLDNIDKKYNLKFLEKSIQIIKKDNLWKMHACYMKSIQWIQDNKKGRQNLKLHNNMKVLDKNK